MKSHRKSRMKKKDKHFGTKEIRNFGKPKQAAIKNESTGSEDLDNRRNEWERALEKEKKKEREYEGDVLLAGARVDEVEVDDA